MNIKKKQNNLPPGVIKSVLMNQITGRSRNVKEIYLNIYLKSLNEAYKLLDESKLLFKNEAYQRAYFLGFSALEEISKSQLAADVYTGLISEKEFKESYRDHKKKIKRVEWIKLDGNSYPIFNSDKTRIKDFDYQKKLKSMYIDVDFNSEVMLLPNDSVSKEDAESIIKAVEVGLFRIYQVTVEFGEQIGTKGFMK